jgi:hypothetical protein
MMAHREPGRVTPAHCCAGVPWEPCLRLAPHTARADPSSRFDPPPSVRSVRRPSVRSPPRRCLTCPRVLASRRAFRRIHLTTSAPFRAGHMPVSGQLVEAIGEGANHHVSGFLVPFGGRRSLLGHPVPLGSWAFLTVGLPAPVTGIRTPTGFPRSARMRYGRDGCPLYPGECGVHTADTGSPAAAPRLSTEKSLDPGTSIHHPGLRLTRHQRGFTRFTRPAFSLPVIPGWNGNPWAFPLSFTPRRYQRRMSRWRQACWTLA